MAQPTTFTLENVLRDMGRRITMASIMVSEFRKSHLLDITTFKSISNAHDEFKRITQLPEVQRRDVNTEFSRTRGTQTMGTEALRIYGTKMGFDRFFERTNMMDLPTEIRLHAQAISLFMEHELIYGDPFDVVDEGQTMGLQFLAENSDGYEGETSISAGSDANGNPISLRGLQDAIDNCFPKATMIVCGKPTKNILTGGSRDVNVSGFISYSEDSFGRRVASFDGLPIVTVDRDHLKQRLLPFNEPDFSGANDSTASLYIVSHNIPEGGWYPFQNGGPFVEEDGPLAQAQRDRDMEWYVGVSRPQPQGVIRYKHIANAPMVP